MPDRVSLLKARYCRAILKNALHSGYDDARRLVFCLATERPTTNASARIALVEKEALDALIKLDQRVDERGTAAIATHWKDIDHLISRWMEAAYKSGGD